MRVSFSKHPAVRFLPGPCLGEPFSLSVRKPVCRMPRILTKLTPISEGGVPVGHGAGFQIDAIDGMSPGYHEHYIEQI